MSTSMLRWCGLERKEIEQEPTKIEVLNTEKLMVLQGTKMKRNEEEEEGLERKSDVKTWKQMKMMS